jgi:hypothetical protein
MTQQEMFDRVARHLLTQMAQSTDEAGCRYRDGHGNMCAIGVLIPPDKYNPEWDQYPAASVGQADIMTACGYGQEELPLASALQSLHDSLYPHLWRVELRSVAESFGLTFPEGV